MKRYSAFTLIELLFVVAIIAMLAAILLPTLLKAKQNAYRIVCLGNQKQINNGFQFYRDSYNEYFPFSVFYPTPSVDLWWSAVLSINVQEHPKIYSCPADTEKTPGKYMYGINKSITSRGYPAAPYFYAPPLKICEVKKASKTFVIMDGKNNYGLIDRQERTDPAYSGHSVENRHFKGMNLLYADGHSAWQKPIYGLGLTQSQIAMKDTNTLYE